MFTASKLLVKVLLVSVSVPPEKNRPLRELPEIKLPLMVWLRVQVW